MTEWELSRKRLRYFLQRDDAVLDVAGVAGVANDLEVRTGTSEQRPDPEIARDAVEAIKRRLPLSYQDIKFVVRDAWVKP